MKKNGAHTLTQYRIPQNSNLKKIKYYETIKRRRTAATKQVMPVCASGRSIKFKIKTELEFSSNIRISGKL